MSVLNQIASAILFLSFIPLGIFIALYAAKSPWKSSALGVSYMVQKLDLFLILAVAAVTAVFGFDFAGREYARIILYTIILTTFWFDLYQLIQAQSAGRFMNSRDRRVLKRQLLGRRSNVKPMEPADPHTD